MSKLQLVLLVVLADFLALTGWSLYAGGFETIIEQAFANPINIQVAVDLALAIGFVCTWIWKDAKSRGANPAPWVALTATTGSIGWLLYMVIRPGNAVQTTRFSARAAA